MIVLGKNVKQDVYNEYEERIVGFLPSGMLVAAPGDNPPIVPVFVVCPRCNKGEKDNGMMIPGDLMLVNPETGLILQETAKVLPETTIQSKGLCPKCGVKEMMKVTARVVCNRCKNPLAWMSPGPHPSGFIFRVGDIYHADGCYNCDPVTYQQGEGGGIVELMTYLKEKGISLDNNPTNNKKG